MKKEMRNQFPVPHNVLEEAKFIALPASTQMLFIRLCKLKNRLQRDEFFRDVDTLSRESGFNKNTITKAKKELVKAQYIGVERNHYTSSGMRSADVFHLNGFKYKGDK